MLLLLLRKVAAGPYVAPKRWPLLGLAQQRALAGQRRARPLAGRRRTYPLR